MNLENRSENNFGFVHQMECVAQDHQFGGAATIVQRVRKWPFSVMGGEPSNVGW